MILQRLRVEFAKREAIQFISHLDLLRVWLRSLRRAGIPLAYSEGYVARPKISLAAPLAVGATGEAELLDVYLHRRMTPLTFMKAIRPYLPAGIEVNSTEDVPRSLPSLQSLVHAADYAVSGTIIEDTPPPATTVEQAVSGLMASDTFLWEHQREGSTRKYDLRPLVMALAVTSWEAAPDRAIYGMSMTLRADNDGTGRPEQVLAAIGLPDSWTSIHRTRLVLQRPQAVRP